MNNRLVEKANQRREESLSIFRTIEMLQDCITVYNGEIPSNVMAELKLEKLPNPQEMHTLIEERILTYEEMQFLLKRTRNRGVLKHCRMKSLNYPDYFEFNTEKFFIISVKALETYTKDSREPVKKYVYYVEYL